MILACEDFDIEEICKLPNKIQGTGVVPRQMKKAQLEVMEMRC